MIEAKELRIGNLIYIGGDYEPIYRLGNKRFWSLLGDKVSNKEGFRYKYANPIPITEDWLLKFGFVHKGGNGYKAPTNTEYWHFSLGNGFIPSIWLSRTIVSDGYKGCKYIHQLQNLYFALTGDELKEK